MKISLVTKRWRIEGKGFGSGMKRSDSIDCDDVVGRKSANFNGVMKGRD